MSVHATTRETVLLCRCTQGGVIPETAWRQALETLLQEGADVLVTDDLCGMAARRDPALADFLAGPSRRVAACHPRAVTALLQWAGAPLETGLRVLDLRTPPPDPPGPADAPSPAPPEGRGTVTQLDPPADAWVPWFPVIDPARCRDCQQCRSFCLFGVYGADAGGRVRVQQPRNCKTHCPACARVCPELAVMFPKFGESPYNGDAIDPAREAELRARFVPGGPGNDDLVATLLARRRMNRPPLSRPLPAGFTGLAEGGGGANGEVNP